MKTKITCVCALMLVLVCLLVVVGCASAPTPTPVPPIPTAIPPTLTPKLVHADTNSRSAYRHTDTRAAWDRDRRQGADFTSTDATGKTVNLAEEVSKHRSVVLVFYRGVW